MAAERPDIRPSEQLLPGGFNKDVATGSVDSMSTLPISDVFEIPLQDIPLEGALDPRTIDSIDVSRSLNSFFTPAGPTQNPNQKLPIPEEFDLSNPGKIELDPEKARMRNPIRFSAADTGFDRYFAHPKFNELGFTPYDPNIEEFYNNNSGLSDDMARMGSEWTGLFGNAFMSGYRAIGDYFSGDGLSEIDFEGAMAFENAMRVGNSSRGGLGGFTNNFLLNSAYTFGIIGSIAAEEVALLFGSAALATTGVGAPAAGAAAVAGTTRNIHRIGKAIKDTFMIGRMASATSSMIKGFNNVDRAKNFWTAVKTGKQPVAKFFLPSTMRALRELNSTKVAAQNLGSLAKISRGFGGFYRDLRAINFAVAESKMEAGLNYNEQFNNGVNILQRQLGRELTSEEMKKVHNNASESSFYTLWGNFPVIYATNQIVLGRALQGFGGRFGRIFDESLTNFGRRIVKTKATRDAAGKAAKDVFEDAGEGFLGLPTLKRIKSWTTRGTLRAGVHGALRYTANKGFFEGVQEVYQEGLNVGTQEYFSELLEHPSAGWSNMFWGALNEGAGSQFTEQGFETFMSGFLMGGLVQGPQRLVFQSLPNLINKVSNPEEYKKYQEDKQNYIDKLVETYNDAYNKTIEDPDFQWNNNKLNFAAIHDAAKEMDSYNYEGDPFGFFDAKDFLRFQQAQTLFDNGGDIDFTRALGDFLNLNDEELAAAFPEAGEDARNGKLRTRIQDTIDEIKKKKKRYQKAKDKYQNKYDPSRFKKGTRAHLMESIKYRAFEHARYLYLFTEDGFYRALERSNSIYDGLASEPLFKNIAASDLQALADAPSIQNEINLLRNEIDAFRNSTDPEVKEQMAAKKRKLKALEKYQKVFTDKGMQISDGSRFSRSTANIKKLRKALLEYVQTLADEKGDFVDVGGIDKVLRMLIDYGDLKGRTRTYDKAIKLLADPTEIDKLAGRMEPIIANLFRKNQRTFRKVIKQKIAATERTELLKAFNKLGILVPPEQALEFMISGDPKILTNFENKEGAVTPESDADLFAKVQELIGNYKSLIKPEEKTEETSTEKQENFDDAKTDQENNFEDADSAGQALPAINTDLITQREESVLDKLYKKYKKSVPANEKTLTEDEWLELPSTRRQYNGIQKLYKLYDEAASKMQPSGVATAEGQQVGGPTLTFDNWFGQNRNNRDIRTLLLTNSLRPSDFVADEVDSTPASLAPNQKFIKKGKGINILEISLTDAEGKIRKVYRIVDNDLQPVDPELYRRAGQDYVDAHANIQSADKVFNTLNKFASEDTAYKFDGIEVAYGDTIVDENGQQYFVIGVPNNLADGNKLKVRVLPDGKEILISEVGFSENYKLDNRSFKEKITRPEKTKIARIKSGELNSAYPLSQNRNSLIEVLLDDPDFNINNITFEISKNKQTEKDFVITNKETGDNILDPNPFIKSLGDKYTVAIKYNGKVIGFVANGQYKFEFNGKPLDLNSSLQSLQFLFDMSSKAEIESQVLAARELIDALDALYKNPISADLQKQLKKYDERDKRSLDAVDPNITDEVGIGVGKEFKEELNVEVTRFIEDESFQDQEGEGYSVFSRVIEPTQTIDGKLSKAGKYEVTIYKDKAAADAAIKARFEKVKSLVGKKQQELLDAANTNVSGSIEVSIQAFQEKGINFNLRGETFNYEGSAKGLDSFDNNTFEGGRLILINRKTKDTKTGLVKFADPDYVSDFEVGSPEAQAQFEKAMKEINQSASLTNQFRRKGYSAVTRRSNGEILLIPLDVDSDAQGMQDLLTDISDMSIKLSTNNIDDKGKAKDPAATKDFNLEIASRVFITGKPGDKLRLRVNALGDVLLDGNQEGKSYSVKLTAEEYKKEGFQGLLAKFNKQGGNIQQNNFRVNIPKEASLQQIVNSTSSTIQVNRPANNRVLYFTVDSEKTQPKKIIQSPQPKDPNTKTDDKIDTGKVSEMSKKSDAVAEIDEAAEAINDAIAQRDAIKKKVYREAREKGISRKQGLEESKEYKAAVAKVDALKKDLGNNAYKILPDNFNQVETEKIDAFITWMNQNLPEFITVGNVNQIGNRLKNNGITAGAFVMALNNLAGKLDINGTVYVGAHGFRYHEAFHAVFRMLLTPEEQKQYLAIAEKELRAKLRKEGKSFEVELQKFRSMSALYESFDRARLKQEFFEEYMADEFEKFKQNPRNSTAGGFIKSFFTRLINWIKAALSGFTKSQLNPLFENIDAGKYKSRGIAHNMFTDSVTEGITMDAYKLLPIKEIAGDRRITYEYLDANTATYLINSFTARILQLSDSTDLSLTEIEDKVYDEYADLYDPNNARYNDITDTQYDRLLEIDQAINYMEGNRPAIILAARQMIDTFKLKQDNADDINDVFENDLGLKATDQFDKDASMVGSVTALPMKLRLYIATTMLEDTDYFGNQFLIDPVKDEKGNIITEGEKLIVPVDVDAVYNGVLKAVKNKTVDYDILSSIYVYGQTNKHTGAFVERLFNDMGIDGERLLEEGVMPRLVKRSAFVQQVIKSFQNARVNYLFIQTDTATSKNYYYDAATRDASKTQLGAWQQMYDQKLGLIKSDPKFKGRVQATLKRAIGRLQAERSKIDNIKFNTEAKKLSQDLFDAIGLRLSPEYLKLSMLKASPLNVKKKTKSQQLLLDNFKDVRTLTVDDLSAIKDIVLAEQNIYSETSGAAARLTSISIGNAVLDEQVGATTFTNADGNLVYAHQMPTFHTRIIGKLNDDEYIEELLQRFPDNALLNNESFRLLSSEKKLELLRFAGFRKGRITVSEQNEIISDGTKSVRYSKTYGKQSPGEFITNLMKAYTFYFNTKSLQNKMSGSQALAPVLIRVLEASNTGDMVALPVRPTVELINKKVVITKETLDVFVKQMQNEYDRIVREIQNPTEDLIVGYNADKNGVSTRDTKEGRAYKLFNSRDLLPEDAIKLLEEAAYEGVPFAEAAKRNVEGGLYKTIQERLEQEINVAYELFGRDIAADSGFVGTGVLTADGSKSGENLNIANAQLNLIPGNFLHNFSQVYLNNAINTSAINELILGDESITLKDSIDQIKRAKGQNAAIRSIEFSITDPQLGIYHPLQEIEVYPFVDPTFEKQSGESMQDQTDAQVYYTEKGFRYTQFGMGNMTKNLADTLDNIKDGVDVPSFYINNYVGRKNALNSKKMVYFDGSTYIKMSVVPLTAEFTSLKDESGLYTIPKPNKVRLHNLRIKMEAYENANDTIIFSAPTTALKMLKKNVDTADQAFSESSLTKGDLTTIRAEYMGLQMVNPSNKIEITSGTQMRLLLTSEQVDAETVTIDGVNLKMRDLKKMYNDNIAGKIGLAHKLRRNAILDENGNLDLFTFLKYAIRNLKAAKTTSNILEQFEVDENGNMKYGLNSPHMVEKAEQLFLSYFNVAMKDRQPGMSLALMADYGVNIYRKVFEVDENGVPTKFEIIRENLFHRSNLTADIDISRDDFTDLKNALKNTKGGVVVIDRLRSDLVDADGLKYSEFVLPAHFQSVHDDFYNTNQPLPEVLQKHFGIRIPSQDKHSAINLRLVDFMPHYMGSTGVFAREILERSGADFDIDKLYTHMKTFYKEGNTYYEYGKNGYKDYIKFVTKELTSSKPSIYKDAFEKWSIGVNNAKPEESVEQVLTMLRMPATEEQYNTYVKKFGEPYSAAYSNKDLDYKYALLGNKAMTEAAEGQVPIIAQEAAVERLRAARKYMEEVVPEWAAQNSEVNVNVNRLLGQYLSYKNNKEGSANIGLAVKPNLVYSLLRENNVTLNKDFSFTINQNKATKFVSKTGQDRTAILFDELITAMTDNAKERLAALLGLDKENLPLVAAGISLGIPLNDIILLVNSPFGGAEYVTYGLKLDRDLGRTPVSTTTTQLLQTYDREAKKVKASTDDIARISARLYEIAQHARLVGNVMNLDKGHGKDFNDVQNTIQDIKEIFSPFVPFAAPMKKSYHGRNIEIFKDMTQQLLPKVFIRYSPQFQIMFSTILKVHATRSLLDRDEAFGNDTKINKMSLDFLSYLLIDKYRDALLESGSKTVGSLSNEFIYENGKGESIVDVVKKLRKMSDKDNYFLNTFLQTVEATDPNSKDGLNKVVSNTFARLSDNQKIKIQNGLAALYGNALTRPDAIKLLHYIIIKDGLQFNTGSIMEALTPFVLEHFLDKTQDGNLDYSTPKMQDFVQGYFKSIPSAQYLTTIMPQTVKGSRRMTSDPVSTENVQEDYFFSEKKARELGLARVIDQAIYYPSYILIGRNLYRLVDDSENKDSVKYTFDRFKGSINQNGIGFMFDTPGFTRPDTNVIKETQDKKTASAPMADQAELLALDKLDFDPGTVDIVANEKSIKISERDISDLLPQRTEAVEVPLEEGEFRVISGGQTGVDQAGLEAASELGIETGGTAPQGYRTERGPNPELKNFGLEESASSDYLSRTEQNVVDSDATVYFAADKNSAGLRATERFAKQYKRPITINPTIPQLKAFIKKYNVKVLNVAGNRESKLTADQLFKFKSVMKAAFPKPKPKTQEEMFEQVEGEVRPETTSKIRKLLKSKTGINEEALGDFWDSEINDNQARKLKTGYNSYSDMLAAFKDVNTAFELTEEEFIEQTRCKF